MSLLSILPTILLTFFTAGCSAPNDLKRSDRSIKFATSADVFADFLSMSPLEAPHSITDSSSHALTSSPPLDFTNILEAKTWTRCPILPGQYRDCLCALQPVPSLQGNLKYQARSYYRGRWANHTSLVVCRRGSCSCSRG